jgi:hypothetical protein
MNATANPKGLYPLNKKHHLQPGRQRSCVMDTEQNGSPCPMPIPPSQSNEKQGKKPKPRNAVSPKKPAHSKEATTATTPTTTAVEAPLIWERAPLVVGLVVAGAPAEVDAPLPGMSGAAPVEVEPGMMGPPVDEGPGMMGPPPLTLEVGELGGAAPGTVEPGTEELPPAGAGGGCSPLAMAWKVSKVLSGVGLIAPTMPALQWLAGLVCGQKNQMGVLVVTAMVTVGKLVLSGETGKKSAAKPLGSGVHGSPKLL